MTQTAPPPAARCLAPGSFAVAVTFVYLASFGSQVLLSPPVTARLNVVPFVLVQAALIVLWLKLHIFRLRDAGRRPGPAVAVAILYAIEVLVFAGLVALIVSAAGHATEGASGEATILHLFMVLYFFSLLTGDPTLGALQVWMMGFAVLLLVPILVGLGFTIWTATRPRVP